MTTARDVIAAYLCRNDDHHLGPCTCLLQGGKPGCSTYIVPADGIVEDLLSAPDSVRLELAGMLNPWRPIETAPNQELILGLVAGQHLIVQRYAQEWWSWVYGKGILHAEQMKAAPTHWLPLPATPSEDKPI